MEENQNGIMTLNGICPGGGNAVGERGGEGGMGEKRDRTLEVSKEGAIDA